MVVVPAVGRTRFNTMRSVVVFPAPLGPRKPVTRPGLTVNDRSSTARTFLYSLGSPLTTMPSSAIGKLPSGEYLEVLCIVVLGIGRAQRPAGYPIRLGVRGRLEPP